MLKPGWKKLDASGMGKVIRACHDQILASLAAPEWRPAAPRPFNKVLFLGMGGSAIGGEMVRIWSGGLAKHPLVVHRDYQVPKWVDEDTLVLAASYSGNTEETLAAVDMSARQGAQITAIASGGILVKLAAREGWDLLKIPSGFQPRAAIGYSLAAICRILTAFEFLPNSLLVQLERGAQLMGMESGQWAMADREHNLALKTAEKIAGKLVIIYGSTGTTEAIALRLRGQLAENSNQFAAHHVLPEQNHNEIVGLRDHLAEFPDTQVIWLTDSDDHPRVSKRQLLTAELLGLWQPGSTEHGERESVLSGEGSNLIERNLTLLSLTDWISYYTALIRGIDPSDIDILIRLKQRLASGR